MNNIEPFIRDINDFPKPGIVFKDLTPLLNNPAATASCLQQLLTLVGDKPVDKVVGMEARGFFFGMLIAQALNAGFVPVRKPGKLPHHTLTETYALEYGTDSLEIHEDAIKPGDRVLIHDDVLATGGTAAAVCKLVERLGGEIVQCNFIMQLDFLDGKARLKGYDVGSVLTY
ncbi:adenine phosphoribosyltransferase [Formosa algae]|uniref:Adenine phosphoribosyltransferase n=1 Tax=Formosa algae TaxID=225843 RepID=A0A9X0YKZ0_9FLAO|nr:adenine phosphoribosyltransferase [Formosa algae]MBP1838836.1 adenine phosphoribosyltransferase [Formosa algae]MDQ0333613.1 adenine phosphoribosyltransferase [Formosa algae]OEI80252.1 adenine phosphoribosyltransferase [Formosa algae]PNW27124.1 adenine phosphoribosyltransferase [Formosa algae]